MNIMVKYTKEEDEGTTRRAFEEAEAEAEAGGIDTIHNAVLDIVGGMPVTVTLKGWEWAGIQSALRRLVAMKDEVGGNDTMVRDVTRLADAIEEQAAGPVNAGNRAEIARRLREAGYGL